MKDTSEPINVAYVDSMFFRSVRKNINCATLTGTAALAAFIASAGMPAQAARHHHHSDSGSQSSDSSSQSASDFTPHHHHHHRHDSDDQTASDTQTVTHHHRHHHESDDETATDAQPVAHHHHHHHHDDSDDTASVPVETHHRHHHHHDDEDIANSDSSITPIHHRHHHHHEDVDDTASAPVEPRHHHHHHEIDDTVASVPTPTERPLSRAEREAAEKKLLRDPAWLAHVARYDAHMENVHHDYELRVVEYEAHLDNIRERYLALKSGNVVRAAEAFRGTPYVMGGTSRSGFDCSGFTRYIFGESAGVDLPRTAEEQYYTGQPIAKCDLRAGDLVFFRDTYRHGISHVGMYIGNDRFVHACSPSRGVTVSSLDEQYYINHWAGARRVIRSRDSDD